MFKLLAIRIVPLLLRPAAVYVEGAFLSGEAVLIYLIPISMMALTVSSIPVHLEYFRTHEGQSEFDERGAEYISSIGWLTLIGLFVLAVTLVVLPNGFNLPLISAICATFLVEKISTETSRALEFRKEYVKWLFVQVLRSGWLFLPAAVVALGWGYEKGFMLFSFLTCIVMLYTFRRVTNLRIRLASNGYRLIFKNIVFMASSLLTATYLQVPRLIVASVFPAYAHTFLMVAQLCQGVTILFNVRFLIPYRAMIARKPRQFQQRMWPAMKWVLTPIVVLCLVYLGASQTDILRVPESEFWLVMVLIPILTSDTLMYSILGAHLEYIQWFVNKKQAFLTYLYCLISAGLLGVILLGSGQIQSVPLIAVPTVTISMGGVWLFIVIVRNFRPQMRRS